MTVLSLKIDDEVSMIFGLEESQATKKEAQFVLKHLQVMGLEVHMITGDNKQAALKVAN